MVQILEDYKTLKSILSDLISQSGYRNDFIAKKIGMAPSYFSTKKTRGNWSDEEMEKILDVIESDEIEDAILLEIMRSRKNDETLSYDEYKKEIASWK